MTFMVNYHLYFKEDPALYLWYDIPLEHHITSDMNLKGLPT